MARLPRGRAVIFISYSRIFISYILKNVDFLLKNVDFIINYPRDGRHSGVVTALAWSPRAYRFCSGAYTIATASADGTVRLWRAERGGVCEVALRGHSKRVTSVAFAAGGGELISSGVDGRVCVWWVGAVGGKRTPTVLGHTGAVEAVVASPTEDLCAATDREFVMVWKLRSLAPLSHDWEVLRPDERRAAAELGVTETQWRRAGGSEGRSRAICESARGLYGTVGREWTAAARTLGGLEFVLRTGRETHGAVLALSWAKPTELVGGCEGGVVSVWRVEEVSLREGTRGKNGVLAAVLGQGLLGPVRSVKSIWLADKGTLRVAAARGRHVAVWRAIRHEGCVWDAEYGACNEAHCVAGPDRWGGEKGGANWAPSKHAPPRRAQAVVPPDQWSEVDASCVSITALDWTDDGKRLMLGTARGLQLLAVEPAGGSTEAGTDGTEEEVRMAGVEDMLASIIGDSDDEVEPSESFADAGLQRTDGDPTAVVTTMQQATHSAVGGLGFGPPAVLSPSGRRILAVGLGAGIRLLALPDDVQPDSNAAVETYYADKSDQLDIGMPARSTPGDEAAAAGGAAGVVGADAEPEPYFTFGSGFADPNRQGTDGPIADGPEGVSSGDTDGIVEIQPGTRDDSTGAFWF